LKQYDHLFRLFSNHLEQYRTGLKSAEPKELYEPEDYILSLGGKRLRPILALVGCELFNRVPDYALDSALCVELFHNFSLIHDDILDAAPLRRNQATVHAKWNTNIAILSGDVMLVKAYQILENYPVEEFKQLCTLFTRTSIRVCEGQQMDMNFEMLDNVTVEDYIKMITYKTAVLLGCSLQMGAINAGANNEEQQNIYAFGKHVGIAFQLLDDLLDAYADTPEFGKQTGGDILSNKKTYLLLKAFELASDRQRKELERFMTLDKNSAVEKISGIKSVYDELDIRNICIQKANEHTEKAIEHLDKIKANESKKSDLKLLANELLMRRV
jgi:geranylgeranyl diphosphate synthase type II